MISPARTTFKSNSSGLHPRHPEPWQLAWWYTRTPVGAVSELRICIELITLHVRLHRVLLNCVENLWIVRELKSPLHRKSSFTIGSVMSPSFHRCKPLTVLCFAVLAACRLATETAKANDEAQSAKPFVTASAVKFLPAKDAESKLPVELHGVVTCVPEGWKGFFLEDGSGGVYCEPQNLEAEKSFWPVRVGEEIQLRGVTAPGHRNSFVAVTNVISRKAGVLPQPDLQTIQQVIGSKVDADMVRVPGHIVGLINIAGEMEYGLLADGMEVQVIHVGFRIDPKVYEHSEVEICGIVIPQETNARRIRILVPDAQCFKMLATHLEVLKATPKTTIHEILQRGAGGSPVARLSGNIYCSDPEQIWLVEKDFGIGWKSRGVLLPEGTHHVELLGIIKKEGDRRWIDYATVLSTTNDASDSIVSHNSGSVVDDSDVNRVVTVTATFWDSNAFNSDIVLSFDAGQSKLTCRLLTESTDRTLPQLQRGAEYQITGLLNAVAVGEGNARELLIRSLDDVIQVSGPPWPVRFTLYIVSFLSAGLAVGLVTAVYHWKQASKAEHRLEIARNDLRHANESLEARVAARTLELDRSNRRLLDEATARLLIEKDRMDTLVCLEDAQSLAQIGSFYWNAGANTSAWSKQCFLIHGLDPQDRAPGLKEYCWRVVETDRADFELSLQRAAGSSEREECRYRISTPDGEVRWLRSLIRSIHDEDGSLIAMDGIVQDVTDVVNVEEQLRQSMKMEVAGRLAGGIAHDLNNTLTIIQLSCYLLDTELRALDVDREVLNHVVAIENASEKSAMLTRQLLTFSRKQVVCPVELNINTVIGTFVPLLRQLLGDSVKIDIQLAEHIADVRLDPGQLEQILMNLILNARDAISGPGQIKVQTESITIAERTAPLNWTILPRAGEYVSISVVDNGTGIAPESLHKIFEPFFSTKSAEKGTGLGLAVVHGIVRQNNGGLFVESHHNHGTMFQVLIPVARQADGSVMNTPRRIEDASTEHLVIPYPGGEQTILLVDDEPAVGRNTEHVLRRLGYSVTTMVSAQDALQLVKDGNHDFQLLITDYSMPYMSGCELANQIREYLPALPVILMSGFLNEEAFRSLPAGLDPIFVQKPFSLHDLTTAIRTSMKTYAAPARTAG